MGVKRIHKQPFHGSIVRDSMKAEQYRKDGQEESDGVAAKAPGSIGVVT